MAVKITQEKPVKLAVFQFLFPFSIRQGSGTQLKESLMLDGFIPFRIEDEQQEKAYYGEGFQVSHRNLERFFLPFTAKVLFPNPDDPLSFCRYTKVLGRKVELRTGNPANMQQIPVQIHSVDVTLCPFDISFITVRTQLKDLPYSTALSFAERFRVLQNVCHQDSESVIYDGGKVYEEIEDYLFKELTNPIIPFLDKSTMEGAYFETLPFFVDERMYVEAFYTFEDDVNPDPIDNFRALHLDGVDDDGKPYVSAGNVSYIEQYCNKHIYERWSPDTVYLSNENTFSCLTSNGTQSVMLANKMYGEYYYILLLNLYHKIVLLKLSNGYSHVQIEQDQEEIEQLIGSITTFTAKYFFVEPVSQRQGQHLFNQLRHVFDIDKLYKEVNQTLNDLFNYKAAFSSKKQNHLLIVLTIYTVITGIYGMNQVIDDLDGHIDWQVLQEYSVFQYIALFVTFTGLIVALAIGVAMPLNWAKARMRKRKTKPF